MTGQPIKFDLDDVVESIAERVTAKLERRLSAGVASVEQRLLTVEQAARYLGRTKASVQHMISAHAIPVVRSDRRVFLDVCDINSWIEHHKEQQV